MAKKQNFKLDDDGFKMDLDLPDLNFDPVEPKDDRHPSLKVTKSFWEGAKSEVMTPSTVQKFVRSALPSNYGSALDMAGTFTDSLKNLYDEAGKEVKPAIKDLKRVTKRVQPGIDTLLPRSIAQKIKKWSEKNPDQPGSTISEDQQRDSSISMQLGQIFGTQMQIDADREGQREVKESIRDTVDNQRHSASMGQFNDMRVAMQQIANYHTRVDVAFQRKSLELQFRHYYVAADLLAEQKRANADSATKLADIQKNTGLPDFVKMKDSERMNEIMRKQFLTGLGDSLFGKRREFLSNVAKKFAKLSKEKITGAAGSFREGLGMVETLADLQQMRKDMGDNRSTAEVGAEEAGRFGVGAGAKWLGSKVRSKIGANEKVQKYGNIAQYAAQNAPQIASSWAKSSKGEGGFFGPAVRFLKEAVSGNLGVETQLKTDDAGSMQQPEVFSRMTNKSITEIIPGYLSRIYQEVRILRTGDATLKPVSYDFTSNRFSDGGTIKKNLVKSLVTPVEKEFTQQNIDKLIDELDKDKKLTPQQRYALAKKLLKGSMNGEVMSAEAMSDSASYSGESADTAKTLAKLFEKYFGDDKTHAKRTVFANEAGNIGQYISDSRSRIEDHVRTGKLSELQEMGLIQEDGKTIDMDKLHSLYLNEPEPEPSAVKPRGRKKKPGVPGFAKGGLHTGGARIVGEEGEELELTGPSRILNNKQTKKLLSESGVKKTNDSLLGWLKKNNTKPVLETMAQSIANIEALVKSINENGPAGGGQKAGAGKHWWDRSLKDTAGNVISGAYSTGRKVFDQARMKAAELAEKGTGLVKGAMSLGARIAEAGAKYGKQKMDEMGDIWVKGDVKARLTKAKLEAGEYYDQATRKVIKSLKDIQGTVLDKDGNIIMSFEEAKKAFVKTKVGEKFLTFFGAMRKRASDAFDVVTGALPPLYNFGLNMVRKAYGLLDRAEDVYVKGVRDPLLLAITMRVGGYRSQVTDKPIHKPSDIDGPVLDHEGNVILSREHIASGLVNKYGKPLRTGIAKILGFVKDTFNSSMQRARNIAGTVAKTAKRGIDAATGFIKRGLGIPTIATNKDGVGASSGAGDQSMVVDKLSQIYKLLQDRLPKPAAAKRRVTGDVDGDGIREGSFQDLMNKKKNKKKDDEKAGTAKADDAKSPGIGKSMLAGLAGLFGKKKDSEEGDSGMGVGKLASMLGIGSAIGAGASAIGGGLLTAASAAGGLALTVGGGLLTALGAIIASPLLLPALVIAGVGAAGYFGYKYLTRKTLQPLSTVRYAQYGFVASDKEHLSAVFGLEDLLAPAITYDNGIAKISDKKVDVKGALKLFNVDEKDKPALTTWSNWFVKRFKPVFLTHLSVLKRVAPKASLASVDDDLEAKDKKAYLDGAKWPDGPYTEGMSPFSVKESLTVGPAEVNQAVQVAQAEIDKAMKSDTGAKEGEGSAKVDSQGPSAATPGAVAGAVAATAAKDGLSGVAKPEGPATVKVTPGMGLPMAAAGAATLGVSTTINGGAVSLPSYFTGRLGALLCARLKTYGLQELTAEKVSSLLQLEKAVVGDLTFPGETVQWKGNVSDLFAEMGPIFGAGTSADERASWVSWFTSRFMPVYMRYARAVISASGQTDVVRGAQALTPDQEIAVAKAMNTPPAGQTSPWLAMASPWPGYVLNADAASIEEHLNFLRKQVKDKPAAGETAAAKSEKGQQQKQSADAVAADVKAKAISREAQAQQEADKPTFFGAVKDRLSDMYKSAKDKLGTAGLAVVDAANSAGTAVRSALGVQTPQGKDVVQPGKGTGGDINALPMPVGNKSWGALKDLITKAAQMVGVDPQLMATIAAVESGFDYTVKSSTSSATGLYQFISETWQTMLKKYGAKYGIDPKTPPTDPRANALLGGEFLRENTEGLQKIISGRGVKDTDLYLAHFLGLGGAKKFISALQTDPSISAALAFPEAAKANKGIFYRGSSALSLGEVYDNFSSLLRKRSGSIGKQDPSFTQMAASTGAPAAPSSAPTAAMAAAGPGLSPTVTPSTPGTASTTAVVTAGAPSTSTPGQASTMGPMAPAAAGPGLSSTVTSSTPATAAVTTPVTSSASAPAPSIPVADQTTGTVAKIPTATPVVPVVQAVAKPTAPTPPSGSELGYSPAVRDQIVQAKYQREAAPSMVGVVDETLKASLGVHRDQLAMLTAIRDLIQMGMKNGTSLGSGQSTPQDSPSQGGALKFPENAKPMPEPPVSMRKRAMV